MARTARRSAKSAQSRIKVHNVPSRGRSTRVLRDGVVLHQLSDLETRLEAELEWRPDVTVIRSQVDLQPERTEAIAEKLGIRHPRLPVGGKPAIMSTDFYFEIDVDGQTSRHARAVKPGSSFALKNGCKGSALKQIVSKLEIERRYWEDEGVEWRLVTDRQLDRVRAANIRLLISGQALAPDRGEAFWSQALEWTAKSLAKGSDWPISHLAKKSEADGKLPEKDFVACIRHLCSLRLLTFDMSQPFTPDLRASDFEFGDGA